MGKFSVDLFSSLLYFRPPPSKKKKIITFAFGMFKPNYIFQSFITQVTDVEKSNYLCVVI